MNQLTENKTNAKAATVIFSVLAILCGVLVVGIDLVWFVSGVGDYLKYGMDKYFIEYLISEVFYFLADAIDTIFLPFLFLLYAAVFHKKAKATFLVPATFGILTLHILFYDFLMPIIRTTLRSVLYNYSAFDVRGLIKLILIGTYDIDFFSVVMRLVLIIALICFAVATIMAFTRLKSKMTSTIFKVAVIIGALSKILPPILNFIRRFIEIFFPETGVTHHYILGPVFGPIFTLLYFVLIACSILAFFIAVIIFFMANKLPYKEKPKKVAVKVQLPHP